METSTTSFAAVSSPADPEAASFRRLSTQLKCLLEPDFPDCADTEIVLAASGGKPVAAHRCILMARSSVIRNHFSSLPTPAAAPEKHRLDLADLLPGGRHIGRDALVAVLEYLYTGSLTWPPQECMDEACRHRACPPAINFVVESMYAASGFQIPELGSLVQRRLFEFVETVHSKPEDIIPIIHVASTCQLPDLLNQCIKKVATSTLDNKYLEIKLPGDTYCMVREIRQSTYSDEPIVCPELEMRVSNIHKALSSDDIGHVRMLLKESGVTLDDAFALHYAADCCTPEMVEELLKLDSAYVNLKSKGGYTPLYMACMRLQPYIVLSLVEKGAVLECAPDGRDALIICKRLTRQKDVNHNAYFCISILERTRGTPFNPDLNFQEETAVTPLLIDNFAFHIRLKYLENRVAIAKLLFPYEAQLAMHIAEANSTEKFDEKVGLNENPTMPNWKLRKRLDALTKTVERGRWYFPRCSDILDKSLPKFLSLLENGNPEDQQIKRKRFYELKEDVWKAFNKDKAAVADKASTESSSSSPRLEMLTLDTTPSQAVDATDSTDALAPSPGPSSQGCTAGTASGHPGLQSADVVVDDNVDVGSKRKRSSQVWDEFRRVKIGDDWLAICMWCHKSLSACSKNGTRHLHGHLKICRSRQAAKGLNQSTLKLSQIPQDSTVTLEKNVFDEEVARKVLALMICIHEYPLSMVEHPVFRKFCAAMQPMFKVVSTNAIGRDILDMYQVQKLSMMKHIEKCQARVAVTMDIWTADHWNKGYMAVTAHYIDDHWKLNSYLLRFLYVPEPHTSEVISDVLHEVLMEWHIERKLSTVTFDNCAISDNLMEKIVHKLLPNSLVLNGSLLHMRYVAQTLNLIVQDGMSLLDERIERVRESVAFWVSTPKRHEKFEEVASQMNIKYQKRISSDCKTRWDSTYAMLSTALDYREVFGSLAQSEKLFTSSCPDSADWKIARELCDRLKMFFDITELLSGTPYVTANLFFHKLCGIYLDIRKWQASEDPLIENMSKVLKEKFEKYWLDVYDLMAVATVLDPRYKLHLVNAFFSNICGEEGAAAKVAEVRRLLYTLVLQYKDSKEDVATTYDAPITSAVQDQGADFFERFMSSQPVRNSYSVNKELDLYLDDPILSSKQELDIIHWWQHEGTKYPTLRKIARDIMAISVTTAPSEWIFSSGGRTISPHRSRLDPNMVEALACMQDWSCADMLGHDSTTIS